jgi:cytochrome c-type biogenesis protein CcmH
MKRFHFSAKLVLLALLISVSGIQASADRAETLGNELICMCGCKQLLSGCEMINCPAKNPMRRELQKYIDEGKDDKTILGLFSDKYGPLVFSKPGTDTWFNLSAWIMPFAVLAAGAIAVVVLLKRVKTAPPDAAPTAPVNTSKYDQEIEEELRNLSPED